jgi:deoxyribonuclease-4
VTPYIDVPVGFCLDTCHCYVAGFDIAKRRGLSEFVGHAQATLGLENVPVLHANDARMTLGSRLDRHANIGAGYIGLEGFRRILNHPELRNKAFILETPVDNPGDDRRNVAALKELVSPNDRSTTTRSSRSGTRAGAKTPRST